MSTANFLDKNNNSPGENNDDQDDENRNFIIDKLKLIK